MMKRILLAEDDNDMRQFLTRALKTAGYEVVSFDNGRARSHSRCCSALS